MFLTTESSLSHQLLKNRLMLQEGRFLLTGGKRQDRREVATQHDSQFIAIRHKLDTADERAEHLRGAPPCLLVAELVVKGCDLLVVILGEVRMKEECRLVGDLGP